VKGNVSPSRGNQYLPFYGRIFIKYHDDDNLEKKVYYYSTQDNNILSRTEKFSFLHENLINTVKWKKLKVKEPYYWFIEKDYF